MVKRHPYDGTPFVEYLKAQIQKMQAKKTQAEIATEAGFVHPNMLSMIKSGVSRMPLDRVPALAKSLECDARQLYLLALKQKGYETQLAAVEEIFHTIVTTNEVAWLKEIRDASDGSDPRLTSRARSAIRAIFGK